MSEEPETITADEAEKQEFNFSESDLKHPGPVTYLYGHSDCRRRIHQVNPPVWWVQCDFTRDPDKNAACQRGRQLTAIKERGILAENHHARCDDGTTILEFKYSPPREE